MKKRLFFAALALLAFTSTASAHNEAHYYLQYQDVASSLNLLPPPPQPGSAYFNYDEAQYKWGKMQRITPRGKQAIEDANLNGPALAKAFSEAFGITISKENTPEITAFYRIVYHLVKRNFLYIKVAVVIKHSAVKNNKRNNKHTGSYQSYQKSL